MKGSDVWDRREETTLMGLALALIHRPRRHEQAPPRLGLHQDVAGDAEAACVRPRQEHRRVELCDQEP